MCEVLLSYSLVFLVKWHLITGKSCVFTSHIFVLSLNLQLCDYSDAELHPFFPEVRNVLMLLVPGSLF